VFKLRRKPNKNVGRNSRIQEENIFKLGDKFDITYGGKYSMDSDNCVSNSVFDGGLQIFLKENCWTIYIDCHEEIKQCYSVTIFLKGFWYHNIEYNLPVCERRRLLYDTSDKVASFYNDFDIKCYVDIKNNLILIGDPFTLIKPICFFDDTYAVVDNNKLKLLILQLDESIIETIKTNKLVIY